MKNSLLAVVAWLLVSGSSLVTAQTWPDYHLTNGTHYTSYGVEDYDPLYPKNLYIDPVAILQAGSAELDNIHDANQVYLDGGTVYASAIDAYDFTWNSGRLNLNGGTHTTTYGLDSGTGKTLNIDSGATVQQVHINALPSGNHLTVNYGGTLSVGDFNASSGFRLDGGTLEVGGTLSGSSFVGESNSPKIILSGADAEWNETSGVSVEAGLHIGVHSGARVDLPFISHGFSHVDIEVSGSGSRMSAELYNGQHGIYGNRLSISDGGTVVGCNFLNGKAGMSGNEVLVTGAGSLWESGSLQLGQGSFYGGNNTLTIEDGGRVSSGYVGVGSDRNHGNSVTVSGENSRWDTGSLSVGNGGENYVDITDGGIVSSTSGSVGGGKYAYPSGVSVSGDGSLWNISGGLSIQGSWIDSGSPSPAGYALLSIGSGGEVIVRDGVSLGAQRNYLSLGTGGRLTVRTNFNASMNGFIYGSGSTLAVEGQLSGLPTLETGRRLETADVLGDMTVHGTYAPGNSPADSILNGVLTLASGGTLEMELGGLLLGDEYDRLTVTDAANLDGTLDIVLLDEFALVYGDSFDLFNWGGGVNGEFASITTTALTGDLEWDTSELYTSGTLTVIPEPASLSLIGLVAGGLYFTRRFFPAV